MRIVSGLAVLAAGAIVAAPFTVLADADLGKELATAEAHAGYAAAATDLKMVQAHLHHVVNCMVGPKGKGFDATQANPCKDQGGGVMVDQKGDKAKRAKLQKALDTVRAGLKATDVAVARQKATDADALLKAAM